MWKNQEVNRILNQFKETGAAMNENDLFLLEYRCT